VENSLQQYILNLVRATQDEEITLGVSPRSQRATQALAFLTERDYAIPDDVKFLAPHVLSHRLIPAGDVELRRLWSGCCAQFQFLLVVEMSDTSRLRRKLRGRNQSTPVVLFFYFCSESCHGWGLAFHDSL